MNEQYCNIVLTIMEINIEIITTWLTFWYLNIDYLHEYFQGVLVFYA